jgi:hypothetical protein
VIPEDGLTIEFPTIQVDSVTAFDAKALTVHDFLNEYQKFRSPETYKRSLKSDDDSKDDGDNSIHDENEDDDDDSDGGDHAGEHETDKSREKKPQ